MRRHVPVLPEEILEFSRPALRSKQSPLIVDGTLGDGGHTLAFRENFPDARLLSNDRDIEMLARAAERIHEAGYTTRDVSSTPEVLANLASGTGTHGSGAGNNEVLLRRGRFGGLGEFLGDNRADFILLDLGISLHHFLGAERGFSYGDDSLDMRLDQDDSETAEELINRLSADELADLFRDYGEEPHARRLARAIVDARPITRGSQLAEIVLKASPGGGNRKGGRIHPATRVFQALRIRVNRELQELEQALGSLPAKIAPGGRLAIISFHSLEDRLVKRAFRDLADRIDPAKLAGMPEYKRRKFEERMKADPGEGFTLETRKPVRPSAEETASNPAARSSVLRVLSKRTDI